MLIFTPWFHFLNTWWMLVGIATQRQNTAIDSLVSSTQAPIFPWHSLRGRHHIVKVSVDQNAHLPASVLIEARVDHINTLWMCFPMSVCPPHQPMIRFEQPFAWVANRDHSLILVSLSNGEIHVYRLQTQNAQWKCVATFQATDMDHETQWIWHSHGAIHEREMEGSYGIGKTRIAFVEQVGQEFRFSYIPTNHWRFGIPFVVSGNYQHLVVSRPTFHQSDGMVDLYQFDAMDQRFRYERSLPSPERVGGFGSVVNRIKDRTMVSSPFASAPLPGAGAIHVFLNDILHQTITCPEAFSAAEQRHLQFGWCMATSENGRYMATTCRSKGNDRVYVFEWQERYKRYGYIHTHELIRKDSDRIRFVIGNSGQLIAFDGKHVYWLVLEHRSRSLSYF